MITQDQLDTLQDIFSEWDADALLDSISIAHDGCRNITITISHAGWQECCELFPDGEGGYDRTAGNAKEAKP